MSAPTLDKGTVEWKATGALEHKTVPASGVTVVDEEKGIVEAFVSVTGLVDRVNDNIYPGAYEKTLREVTPKGVVGHDWNRPVSRTLEVEEVMPGDSRLPTRRRNGQDWPKTAGAVRVLTQYNLDTQDGRETFSNVKFFGPEQEWSIGYKVPPGGAFVEQKSGVRGIRELMLYEYSTVLFGAMPDAMSVGFKDALADPAQPWPEGAAPEGEPVEVQPPSGEASSEELTEERVAELFVEAADEIAAEQDRLQARVDELVRSGNSRTAAKSIAYLETQVLEMKRVDTHPGDGGARQLARYWAHGEGAVKVGWGTEGDFYRCVALVSKHMSPANAKGYCNLRHHEATGTWPGSDNAHKGAVAPVALKRAPRVNIMLDLMVAEKAFLDFELEQKAPSQWHTPHGGWIWQGGRGTGGGGLVGEGPSLSNVGPPGRGGDHPQSGGGNISDPDGSRRAQRRREMGYGDDEETRLIQSGGLTEVEPRQVGPAEHHRSDRAYEDADGNLISHFTPEVVAEVWGDDRRSAGAQELWMVERPDGDGDYEEAQYFDTMEEVVEHLGPKDPGAGGSLLSDDARDAQAEWEEPSGLEEDEPADAVPLKRSDPTVVLTEPSSEPGDGLFPGGLNDGDPVVVGGETGFLEKNKGQWHFRNGDGGVRPIELDEVEGKLTRGGKNGWVEHSKDGGSRPTDAPPDPFGEGEGGSIAQVAEAYGYPESSFAIRDGNQVVNTDVPGGQVVAMINDDGSVMFPETEDGDTNPDWPFNDSEPDGDRGRQGDEGQTPWYMDSDEETQRRLDETYGTGDVERLRNPDTGEVYERDPQGFYLRVNEDGTYEGPPVYISDGVIMNQEDSPVLEPVSDMTSMSSDEVRNASVDANASLSTRQQAHDELQRRAGGGGGDPKAPTRSPVLNRIHDDGVGGLSDDELREALASPAKYPEDQLAQGQARDELVNREGDAAQQRLEDSIPPGYSQGESYSGGWDVYGPDSQLVGSAPTEEEAAKLAQNHAAGEASAPPFSGEGWESHAPTLGGAAQGRNTFTASDGTEIHVFDYGDDASPQFTVQRRGSSFLTTDDPSEAQAAAQLIAEDRSYDLSTPNKIREALGETSPRTPKPGSPAAREGWRGIGSNNYTDGQGGRIIPSDDPENPWHADVRHYGTPDPNDVRRGDPSYNEEIGRFATAEEAQEAVEQARVRRHADQVQEQRREALQREVSDLSRQVAEAMAAGDYNRAATLSSRMAEAAGQANLARTSSELGAEIRFGGQDRVDAVSSALDRALQAPSSPRVQGLLDEMAGALAQGDARRVVDVSAELRRQQGEHGSPTYSEALQNLLYAVDVNTSKPPGWRSDTMTRNRAERGSERSGEKTLEVLSYEEILLSEKLREWA